MKLKYENLYGIYEDIFIPNDQSKEPDVFVSKQTKSNDSMSSGILALRILNKSLASIDADAKQLFEEEASLGKRHRPW